MKASSFFSCKLCAVDDNFFRMQTPYRLTFSGMTGTSGLDVRVDGRIRSIFFASDSTGQPVAGDDVYGELSFLPTTQQATNDINNVLIAFWRRCHANNQPINFESNLASLDIPVFQGERIYLNQTSDVAQWTTAIMFVEEGDGPATGRTRDPRSGRFAR